MLTLTNFFLGSQELPGSYNLFLFLICGIISLVVLPCIIPLICQTVLSSLKGLTVATHTKGNPAKLMALHPVSEASKKAFLLNQKKKGGMKESELLC